MRPVSTLAEIKDLLEREGRLHQEARQRQANAEASEKQTRAQFDDLKKRLFDSEMEVQRLRGYMQRVQEDDTVREELVTIGEPGGQQQLVPKRKSAPMPMPVCDGDYLALRHDGHLNYGEPKKPKHWVTY